MPIYLHGGKCCGVKHVFGLGMRPEDDVHSKGETVAPPNEANGFIQSGNDFFTSAAPEETHLQRLDRELADLISKRPFGLVEVVLASYQFAYWRQPLLERGFKKVTKFKNGNSGNQCEVYHLVTKGE